MSLLLNAATAYWFFTPPKTNAVRMTCEEATDEMVNNQATQRFDVEYDGSLIKTHEFLRASDFTLRDISQDEGQITFVYTAHSYPLTCGS